MKFTLLENVEIPDRNWKVSKYPVSDLKVGGCLEIFYGDETKDGKERMTLINTMRNGIYKIGLTKGMKLVTRNFETEETLRVYRKN